MATIAKLPFRRGLGLTVLVGSLALAGCCLPGGGTGPPPTTTTTTTAAPAPALSVTTRDPGTTNCVGGNLDADTCDGGVVVTVTNTGTAPTTEAVVLSIPSLDNDGAQGSCSAGPLSAGSECTATIQLEHIIQTGTTISGTVDTTAGGLSASAPFTLVGTEGAGTGD